MSQGMLGERLDDWWYTIDGQVRCSARSCKENIQHEAGAQLAVNQVARRMQRQERELKLYV